MSTDTTDAASIARRVPEDVATGRNIDLVDELYAEDCVEHGPFGEETHGREEVKSELGAYLDAFPDFEATVEDVVTEGETVAMRVTLSGTHEGTLMGVEPTGNASSVSGISVHKHEGDKIVEAWTSYDSLRMMQNVEAVPEMMPADD